MGPAEFLPLLLGVNDGEDSSSGDPYTSTASKPVVHQGALKPTDLLPFLNDLIVGFPDGSFADVITPTLSLFFQKWFQITPTPDLLGNEWRKYLGAVSLLVQVKGIAALVSCSPSLCSRCSSPRSLCGSRRMSQATRWNGSLCSAHSLA